MIIPLFFLETGSAGSVLFSQTVCCGGDTVVHSESKNASLEPVTSLCIKLAKPSLSFFSFN